MKTTMTQIRKELERFQELLKKDMILSFSGEEKAALLGEIEEFGQRLAAVQASFLTIGILGGTGVGKSTLMNALAGAAIASTSHRRPHTEHVLIYKHEDAGPLPVLDMENLPWHEVTHNADAVKHVLLCDLPDYDSLADEHRQRVIAFLKHLDVLVWLTSLDKYGDSRFYEFLREVPKAEQNFIFVLNKVDILFEGKTDEEGYDQLDRAVITFRNHILDHEVADPLMYAVSSGEAADKADLSPWNQFKAFRQHVFLQRDKKQVMAIKEANMDIEAGRLFSSLERETRDLEAFVSVLDEGVREIRGRRTSLVQMDLPAMDSWLDSIVMSGFMPYGGDPTWLVGPGYGIALIFQSFQGRSGRSAEEPADFSGLKPPEEIILSYRKRFEWAEEHLIHAVHRQNLAAAFEEKARETLKVETRFDALGERFFNTLLSFAAKPVPAFRAFKLYQASVYALLFAFLLIAVGGQGAWLAFLDEPGAGKALQLLITMIDTIFSTRGLAALGSYALLNLFLGFRFYRRSRRLLQKASQKTREALMLALSGIWEESLDELAQGLEGLKSETASRLETISSIRKR